MEYLTVVVVTGSYEIFACSLLFQFFPCSFYLIYVCHALESQMKIGGSTRPPICLFVILNSQETLLHKFYLHPDAFKMSVDGGGRGATLLSILPQLVRVLQGLGQTQCGRVSGHFLCHITENNHSWQTQLTQQLKFLLKLLSLLHREEQISLSRNTVFS